MEHALQIRELSHSYDASRRAVDGLDLEVERGEIVALLGPNGAGKTTTVRATIGLITPDVGTIRVAGANPADAAVRRRMGVVQQEVGFPRTLTVRDVVRGAAARAGVRASRVEAALAEMGIEGLATRRASMLSGGQAQRLQLAMGLVTDPVLLVLDEPTAGLDVLARRTFWESVRSRAASGAGVVLTTHIVGEAGAIADRVVVVNHGRVVADGTPSELARLLPNRRVEATSSISVDVVRALDGVADVQRDGKTILVTTSAAEDVARWMLHTDSQLTDLTITAASLEDVLVSMTQEVAA
jgi:ABC-2 type transport system ATP-binding protein